MDCWDGIASSGSREGRTNQVTRAWIWLNEWNGLSHIHRCTRWIWNVRFGHPSIIRDERPISYPSKLPSTSPRVTLLRFFSFIVQSHYLHLILRDSCNHLAVQTEPLLSHFLSIYLPRIPSGLQTMPLSNKRCFTPLQRTPYVRHWLESLLKSRVPTLVR